MKSNIMKLIYGVLIIAVGICIFCASMILKNSDGAADPSAEASQEEPVQTQTPAFDSLITNSGTIVSKELNIQGVPCIVCYGDVQGVRPVMIIQHGLTSSKEEMKDLANAFVQQGYLVVTPDAAAHGGLKNKDKWSLADMICKTSEDFDTILSYLSESSNADMERIGIAGISLGGISAFHYVKNGSFDPKVVVTMCATPKYEDLAGTLAAYSYVKNGKLTNEGKQEQKEKLDEALILESPYESILADNHTNYFLLCGDKDDVVPHQGNLELYEAKKDTAPEMVLRVKEGQGHTVTEDDLWEILAYVVAHL